ncbi:MAG: sigma-54-dependent Fis family transcriptional regulator, partial [Nitrospira sp.]|nr:sigma-54-dependent Fis family transcriptional regulator [Nitrospira sp.]
MLNVLVITEDATVPSLIKSCGFALCTQYSEQKMTPLRSDSMNLSKYDLVLLDLDNEGWKERLLELRKRTPVIAFSKSDVRMAVDAMRLGACDYLEKPLAVEALTHAMSKYRNKFIEHESGFDEIVGVSAPMQEAFSLIRKAAVGESNVLITGESGVGKEPAARAIHRWSPRKEKAFMVINCSAIPDTLLESELFGFEKGAFTGANYTKKGFLELADGGTVFFDEIGDVSPLFQTKILRVLQEGEIMRIGGLRHRKVDLRIISASNKDLTAALKKGSFREDLFYRLNVIHIHLLPLRERKEDIPFLVKHFIKKYAPKRKDILIRGISDEAMNILMGYSYPGNVRELENIIEHAISFTNTPEIIPSDLPSQVQKSPSKRSSSRTKLKESLEAFERELIWSALQDANGNISRAATSLGVYRQHLQRKIKKLGSSPKKLQIEQK